MEIIVVNEWCMNGGFYNTQCPQDYTTRWKGPDEYLVDFTIFTQCPQNHITWWKGPDEICMVDFTIDNVLKNSIAW